MKKMNIVRNTNAEGTETYRERSRIGSINHRIWSVFAPMLFIAFGLFGVNVNAWGAYTATLNQSSDKGFGSTTGATFSISGIGDWTGAQTSWSSRYKHCAGYQVQTGASAKVTWSGVASGKCIKITNVTLKGSVESGGTFNKNQKMVIYTSVSGSETTKNITSSGNTSAQSVSLTEDTYLKDIGNSGSITMKSTDQKWYIESITITYTIENLPTFGFTISDSSYPTAGGTAKVSFDGKTYTNNSTSTTITGVKLSTSSASVTAYFKAATADGYEFVKWSSNSGCTDNVSSANPYSVDLLNSSSGSTTTKSLYAYFKPLQYYYFKAQANKVGNGTVYASFTNTSFTSTTDTKSERAATLAQTQSTITPTAYFKVVESDANYHFAGWYTDAACTEANRVSTDLEYSVVMGKSNKTSAETALTQTLYAKFVRELTPEISAAGYVDANPKTMKVGDNIESAFSFLNTSSIGSGLTVASSNTSVLVYDAGLNKISAVGEGTASITFTQSYTGIIKAKTFTFKFSVSRVENTLALNTYSETKYVDEEITGIITNKNSNAVIETSSSDSTIAYYDVTNDKIVIPNSESKSFDSMMVTIHIKQAATYKYTAADKEITLKVKKYQPTISVNKIALELEQTATLTTTNTTADLNVTIEPATGVLNYANGTFTAVGLGDAKVTVTQPEVRTTSYKQEVFNFHVSKKTPTLVVKMNGTAATSKSVTRGTVVNVAFEENSDADVVVTPVSGAQYASFIDSKLTAGATGTAVYRASLAETGTYQEKTVDFSLTVTSAASNHVPFTIDTQARYNALNVEGKSSGDHEWNNSNGVGIGETDSWTVGNWDDKYVTFKFEGVPDKLTFDYIFVYRDNIANKMTATPPFGSTVDGQLYFIYVEESADGSTWSALMNDQSIDKDNWKSCSKSLKKTTRYIRFHLHADYGAWFRNIKVSELKYVETPDPETVDFGSAVINSGEVSKTSLINWCNIAPMTVTSSNPRFTVTPVSFGNFETYATQTLTVKYTHTNEAGTNEGDITISNGDATYTKTIHVTAETTKRPQTITWNSDLVATGYAMNVGEQYPDEVITTIATATNGGNITYTSDKTDVIEVIDGVSLSAVGTGKAKITAYQAGDDDFKEVYDTKEFTVTELQKQVITWNQNLYGLLTTSGEVTLNATATSGMDITYESANDNVVRVEGNTLIVEGEGETYITALQAGGKDANDVEWLPISQNNYVIVRNPNSQCNGLALSLGSLTLNNNEREFALTGIPQTLTFTAKHGKKSALWGTAPSYAPLIVEQFAFENNQWDWSVVYNKVTGTDNTASGNITLDESATKIRISTIESGTDYTISNIRVTRPKFMKSDVSVVDLEVETNALWQKTVTISHSNIDVMKISTKKGLLTLSTSSLGDGCEDFGEDQFVVSYTPTQKDAEYLDTIVITDSKAEPTTITIPIRLHTKGWTQEIENFNLPAAALTTDALPALTATATSGLDVRYESSDEEVVRIVNGNELEIITSGTVTIKAIQEGNNRYYETYAEKSITISKAVPALIAPVGTDVTYLAALSTSLLSDGSATVTLRGVENTPVDGTFVWTNPAQQITDNVGVHSYSVTFTPDDTAYYASATTMVEIKIIAATPEATPSAANIVYGQKVSASLLSNVGTDGTWAWNTGNNEAVLDAGTYNDLAVHFTPTSGNYTGLDATVSLKVEKAAASLNWTTAPTELAFNATGVTYEASSVSDGVISYSIVSGNDYAKINAKTGVLTILVPGQTVTVQAAQTEGTNYLAPEAITINVTIGAAPSTNTFTNAKGDGNWDDPANWESGSVPSSDPDIFVTGDLVIDKNITVGNLTIESTGSVAVISGDTLTVNGTSEPRSEYGDVHVMSDGALALSNSADLQVRDFTLDAALGNSSNAATSGQVNGDVNLHINRDAYFQMSFDPRGAIDYGWYDFTVPFEVEVLNGVYDEHMNKLTNGVDYIAMNFNEARRASSGKGWGSFTGTMQPGRIYSIGFDETKTWNTFIFKKKSGSYLLSNGSFTTECSNVGAADDRGWNGLGNGTLQHRELTSLNGEKVQVYNHSEDRYEAYDADEKAYAVGTAFFVQADANMGTIDLTTTDGTKALRAPQYASRALDEFRLTLTAEGEDRYTDRMWVSASDEATGEYVIGHDLLKMGTPKDAKVAQMWTVNNDLRLCDIEMPLINDMSQCPLMFFAPNALTYEIAVDQAPEDATLYLTYNDRIIWSLSASPYTIDLTKGTTEGYGLRIVARHHSPSVATGMDELNVDQDGNRKVLIDNILYIITPEGAMYSVTGEKVK